VSALADPALAELERKAAGRHEPRAFVLSAPAGAGKDTVLDALLRRNLGVTLVRTCTTRPQRAGEVDGASYRFLSEAEFERLRAAGEFLESAEYAGHHYGTPKQAVRDALARGQDVLLKIEVQGAATVKRQLPQAVLIFLAPPDAQELERRLRARATEGEAEVQRRLAQARHELARIPDYDYLVINHRDRLREAVDQLAHIILAERARVNVPAVRL
jgi:guanylate kinase